VLSKIAVAVILVALAWGLEQVLVGPLETGSAYPEYSTLRSDPRGALALYESLAKVTTVQRLYKSRTQTEAGAGATLFVMGVDPAAWSKISEETLKEYGDLTGKGIRLVIAFLPIPDGMDRKAFWGISFKNNLLHAGPEWKLLDKDANAVERTFGKGGAIVLVGNSYPLSNEGLREARDAALIVKLAGNAREIVFDENHFGVTESGSITKLMRKYHLEGALAMLGIVAALFLWRSASSLLPSRAPRADQAVTGRDSLEGMTALLRRGIAEKDLVRTCFEEWKKTSSIDARSSKVDLNTVNQKNVVAAYREIKALVEKT
jgi:hypothetical protein